MSYESIVLQFKKMLGNVEKFLDAGEAYAKKKNFDPSVLLNARLAPDQWALTRQIQAACDSPKFAVARLTGKEAPKHPDTEQTVDELRQRIHAVVAYLDTFTPADFASTETRRISLPFLGDKTASAQDYLQEMVLPNFYFHVTTAYDILRHNGVELGKMDFIGSMNVS